MTSLPRLVFCHGAALRRAVDRAVSPTEEGMVYLIKTGGDLHSQDTSQSWPFDDGDSQPDSAEAL